jgi:predicted permease
MVRGVVDVIAVSVMRRRRAGHSALSKKGERHFWAGRWAHELRVALRLLYRQPAISLLIVVMLGLSVASNVAVFTLVDSVFVRPFPFPAPDRLVYLNETAPRWNLELVGINYPDFAAWRAGTRTFEAMTVLDNRSFNLTDAEGTERASALIATYEYPAVLGIEPMLGRFIRADEDVPGGAAVVVLSHGLWQSRFGGRLDAVNQTLRLDGIEYTIIGVLPPAASAFPFAYDVWVAMQGDAAQAFQSYRSEGIGRLRDGATLRAAESDLAQAQTVIWNERDKERVVSPLIRPLRQQYVGNFRSIAIAVSGAVALVLLVACANIASVMLARASSRRHELGVRIALGARRSALLRQFLAESVVLSAAAGVMGTLVGYGGARLMRVSLAEQLPQWVHLVFDIRVVAFSVLAVAVTTALFGWAPMLQTFQRDVRSALGAPARSTATSGNRRLMAGLVIAEVALASVLMIAGGLLLRAFDRLRTVDPGFRVENVLMFRLALTQSEYADGERQYRFYQDLLDRLKTLPGVISAAAITCPPLTCHWGQFFRAEGSPQRGPNDPDPVVLFRFASPDYANAAGLRLKSGRFIEEADAGPNAPNVLVVNETFARTFWPGATEIVGRRVRSTNDSTWTTVIGVVEDIKHYGLEQPMRPGIYMPLRSDAMSPSLALMIHTAVPAESLADAARAAVREMNPGLAVFALASMEATLERSLRLRRTYSVLLATFALVALLLAAGGVYGVLSNAVAQRSHEIGIRVALGARRHAVLGMVLRQGVGLVIAGLTFGFLASIAMGRLLGSLLFGITPRDPATYAAVGAVLVLSALLATLSPARRAVGVDPMRTLRES